jgi:hypothetical protein
MAHPSKRKGDRFEREVVDAASALEGVYAERAWMSDGRSLGEASDVDVIVAGPAGSWKLQCKRRKSIAKYLTPPASCDATVIREDYGDALAVVPLPMLLDLLCTTTE